MDDIKRIQDALRDYPESIYQATIRTEALREIWSLTTARYDYEIAKAFLTAKAVTVKTVGEAERQSIVDSYETYQTAIVAESAYRRALADQMRLENEFTGIRKQAELLKLTEQHIRAA